MKNNKRAPVTRSKAEKVLENKLKQDFRDIPILFNTREILLTRLELDVYFPSLKIAIEINGIHHYKAIYSEERFLQAIERDERKKRECEELGIRLFIIDIHRYPSHKLKHLLLRYYRSEIRPLIKAAAELSTHNSVV